MKDYKVKGLRLIALIYFVLSSSISFAQRVQIEFYLEGDRQNVEDSEIYFLVLRDSARVVYAPTKLNSSFQLPDFGVDTLGNIILRYKNRFYVFGSLDLRFSQDMRWVLGFDKRPFKQGYSTSITEDLTTKAIAYLENHPQQWGEGHVTTVGIVDVRKYFRVFRDFVK